MKQFIQQYHGAEIYEILELNDPDGQPINYKFVAKALLPGNGNLCVDFINESDNREKALENVRNEITQYLEEHNLRTFVTEDCLTNIEDAQLQYQEISDQPA